MRKSYCCSQASCLLLASGFRFLRCSSTSCTSSSLLARTSWRTRLCLPRRDISTFGLWLTLLCKDERSLWTSQVLIVLCVMLRAAFCWSASLEGCQNSFKMMSVVMAGCKFNGVVDVNALRWPGLRPKICFTYASRSTSRRRATVYHGMDVILAHGTQQTLIWLGRKAGILLPENG